MQSVLISVREERDSFNQPLVYETTDFASTFFQGRFKTDLNDIGRDLEVHALERNGKQCDHSCAQVVHLRNPGRKGHAIAPTKQLSIKKKVVALIDSLLSMCLCAYGWCIALTLVNVQTKLLMVRRL